ncbi:MAG: response regulator [Candidatus Margulisiibacteriota bacterium]
MEKATQTKTRVLVTDDEHNIRKIIKLILTHTYDVFEAESGEKALETLKNEDINIVFLDVVMPGLNGIETLEQIKLFNPEIEVCMVTATDNDILEAKANKLGAIGWLEKPFEVSQLLEIAKKMEMIIDVKQRIRQAVPVF